MKEHLKGKIGEDAVNHVAEHAYLKYWCYPNPMDESGKSKEICDLLILFKDTTIIISIKNYEFKGNYERYFRNTLEKAISQIQGAERKLFNSNSEIVFNHPTTGEHRFERNKYKNIQRVIINLSTEPLFYPGGTFTKNDKFIHVFNWFAFLKTVNELDTIFDFIEYLNEREKTFYDKELLMLTGRDTDWTENTNSEFHNYSDVSIQREKQMVLFSGHELDLLASYLFNERTFNQVLKSKKYQGSFLEYDGTWDKYISRKEVVRKKEEDKKSYFIDEFIKREILHYNNKERIEIATELLALSRFERRIAGENFYSFIDKYKNCGKFYTARRFGNFGDLTLCYFIHGEGIDLENTLKLMQILAYGYSLFNNYKTKKILILGINASLTQTKFAYYKDIKPFTKAVEDELKFDLKQLNWFQNMDKIENTWNEYPEN